MDSNRILNSRARKPCTILKIIHYIGFFGTQKGLKHYAFHIILLFSKGFLSDIEILVPKTLFYTENTSLIRRGFSGTQKEYFIILAFSNGFLSDIEILLPQNPVLYWKYFII